MASNKLSMVGLAFRGGRALAGSAACEKGLKLGRIRLLLVQQGLSAGSMKRFAGLCERSGASIIMVEAKEDIGKAVGRPGVMVLGITDSGIADKIKNNLMVGEALNEQTENH